MKKNNQQTAQEMFMAELNLKPYQKRLLKWLCESHKKDFSLDLCTVGRNNAKSLTAFDQMTHAPEGEQKVGKILYDDIKTALGQAIKYEKGEVGVFPVVLRTTKTKRYCPRCDKRQRTSIHAVTCSEVFFGKMIDYPQVYREYAICGRPLVDGRLQRENDRALAKAFLKKYGAFPELSTHELKEIQERLSVNNEAFDQGLGCPRGTWKKYLNGEIPSEKHNKDLKALWEEYQKYKDVYGAFLHPKYAPKSFGVLMANAWTVFDTVWKEQKEQDQIGAKEVFSEIKKHIREDLLEDTKVKLDKKRVNMPEGKDLELFALCMQELEPWDVIVTNTKVHEWVERVFNVYQNEDLEYERWLRKPKMVIEKRGERLTVTTGTKEWVLHV